MNLKGKIEIVVGDITEMEVDAIVNAANTDLRLGSGVAGAIRKKGGPSIQAECDKAGPVKLGEAAITAGGLLKARYVIHAAGMHLGGSVSGDSLKTCIESSLKKATKLGIHNLAFPAIGTGVGNFPLEDCAEIMLGCASEFLQNEKTSIEKIYFVLFDEAGCRAFNSALEKMDS